MPEVSLPYRTDWQEMLAVAGYIKGSGADRASLDARFGAGETLRETLNALEELRLVGRDDADFLRLTDRGDRLAYAMSEEERQRALVESFLQYEPYRVPLSRVRGEDRAVIDGPWLERVWQMDMRLGQPRNRVEEARTFFLRLAEVAGLGSFQRGVRGQPSRLALAPEYADRMHEAEVRMQAESAGSAGADEDLALTIGGAHAVSGHAAGGGGRASTGVQVVITVDMTEWDLERVERFLDLLAERVPGAGITVRASSAGDISH